MNSSTTGPNGSITAQDVNSTTTTGANSVSIVSGTPSGGSAVATSSTTYSVARIELSGTWTGTVTFEVSQDNQQTWIAQAAQGIGASMAPTTTTTGNGVFALPISGTTHVRARATAAWT